jgi:hypothetical protein
MPLLVSIRASALNRERRLEIRARYQSCELNLESPSSSSGCWFLFWVSGTMGVLALPRGSGLMHYGAELTTDIGPYKVTSAA